MAHRVTWCDAAACPELVINPKRRAAGQTDAIDPKRAWLLPHLQKCANLELAYALF
jgi:hypothetical protein